MRQLAPLSILCAALTSGAAAQGFPQPSGFTWQDPVLRRMWAAGMDSSALPDLSQVLLDSLGPRLTASPGMEAAQDWLLRVYSGWGITARKEQYGTWRGWRRMYMLPPGGACAAVALILRPHTTVRIYTPLPADIPPGSYRARFLWIDSIPQGRDAPLISHSFRIH